MGGTERDHGTAEQNVAIDSTYMPDLNDKAMERRVVRKIDMHILPFICISYLINYLDRVRLPPQHGSIYPRQNTYRLWLGQLGQRTNIEQRHPFGQHRH